jgi:hypothetical protein
MIFDDRRIFWNLNLSIWGKVTDRHFSLLHKVKYIKLKNNQQKKGTLQEFPILLY